MAKTGRNEPCPCGSGRKYKKCCLQRDESAAPRAASTEKSDNGREDATPRPPATHAEAGQIGPYTDSEPADWPLTPYAAARTFERSEEFATMKRRQPRKAAQFWTLGRIAEEPTEAILSRLRTLGVDTSREVFLALASARTSAWGIGAIWKQAPRDTRRNLSRHDEDFLGMAACELWKRWSPERPSVEMLDDWMQAGYAHSMANGAEQACETWLRVWQVIDARLQPEMRCTDDALSVFDGVQCIFNWVQDFIMELHNAAVRQPRWAPVGVDLCRRLLAAFPDESKGFLGCVQQDLGNLLALDGRIAEAEEVLRTLIEEDPADARGYAMLSDLWGVGIRPGLAPLALDKAVALLRDALARPVRNPDEYDLELRLEALLAAQRPAAAAAGVAKAAKSSERGGRRGEG